MAIAQKGDPLKKQKDSLNIKNRAVEKLIKGFLTGVLSGGGTVKDTVGKTLVTPRKVKTIEKERRRKKKKITKTKY